MNKEMGLVKLYATVTSPAGNEDGSAEHLNSNSQNDNMSFCKCVITENSKKRKYPPRAHLPYKSCCCGEDVADIVEWVWDDKLIQPHTVVTDKNVSFHPVYSQGTSVVRGELELQKGMIHYWEVKIVSWFPGTDLMIGIGTDLVNMFDHQYTFRSTLGTDNQSWGYSYRGMKQHNGTFKCYGKQFAKQSIIGVCLDLLKGHLEFYVNRISQGIAYNNIALDNNRALYPMACSTSAKSSIRLINASSFTDCLQYRCIKVISRYPQLLDKVRQIPGLSRLCKNLWYLTAKERYEYSPEGSSIDYYADIVDHKLEPDNDDDDDDDSGSDNFECSL